jgi:hypothetical protein
MDVVKDIDKFEKQGAAAIKRLEAYKSNIKKIDATRRKP